ncbi:head-tail joining protein [Sodalis endosymbiont of Spalangia cameroni]|uniref:head-tail joining protein n=1 Tax=Sodalis praecaptivus TaxID=1239307 RepID=UPI0031F7A725
MGGFDNLFDEALSDADSRIITVMGRETEVFINGAPTPVRAVFDLAESVDYAAGSNIRIDGSSPRLFVKSADVATLQRLDRVRIGAECYWVDRIGPEDTGSCHIYLGVGEPPTDTRRARAMS